MGKDLEMADLEQQQKQEAAEAKKKEKELAKQQKAAEKEAKKRAKAEAKALKQAEKEAKKAEAGIQEDGENVKPKKEKYSKKNNPAVDFVKKIMAQRELTDPRRNDYYNYNKYERITIALNNFDSNKDKNLLLKKFPFLIEHIDASEVSGTQILNVSVKKKTI